MIKIYGEIPHKIHLACSGGVDSMAVLDFLRRGKKEVIVSYFNHGTQHSKWVWDGLKSYCDKEGIERVYGEVDRDREKGESLEEYWRNIRYKFLNSIDGDVITCHHLDDVIETYLFTTINGKSKLINYRNQNVIRPFLGTKKSEFVKWCQNKSVPFWDDLSNSNTDFSRNRIRHNIIPEVLKINPGIHKVVKKLLDEQIIKS